MLLITTSALSLLQLVFIVENPYNIIGVGETVVIKFLRFSKMKEIVINLKTTKIEIKHLYI